ncbi:deoR-like helix-turn-helix domain protein, partial [Vibrio parahaemolyticus EKP-021]
SAKN